MKTCLNPSSTVSQMKFNETRDVSKDYTNINEKASEPELKGGLRWGRLNETMKTRVKPWLNGGSYETQRNQRCQPSQANTNENVFEPLLNYVSDEVRRNQRCQQSHTNIEEQKHLIPGSNGGSDEGGLTKKWKHVWNPGPTVAQIRLHETIDVSKVKQIYMKTRLNPDATGGAKSYKYEWKGIWVRVQRGLRWGSTCIHPCLSLAQLLVCQATNFGKRAPAISVLLKTFETVLFVTLSFSADRL